MQSWPLFLYSPLFSVHIKLTWLKIGYISIYWFRYQSACWTSVMAIFISLFDSE